MNDLPRYWSSPSQLSVEEARSWIRDADDYLLPFDDLSDLYSEVAEVLCTHNGALSFGAVTSMSRDTARALARQRGWLYLRGVASLLEEALESLVKHRGEGIDLSGMKTIDLKAAEHLATYRSRMRLGVVQVSDDVAEILAGYEGTDLQLDYVCKISEYGLATLLKNPAIRIPGGPITSWRPGFVRMLMGVGDLEEDHAEASSRFLAEEEYDPFGVTNATPSGGNDRHESVSGWAARASRLTNEAAECEARGSLTVAERLFVEVAELIERECGASSDRMAIALANLGLFYGKRSLAGKAEPCLSRALAIHEGIHGGRHHRTASIAFRLSLLSSGDKAESLCRRVRSFREEVQGPQHRDSKRSLEYHALLLQLAGNDVLAEKLFSRLVLLDGKALTPSSEGGVWAAYHLALSKMRTSKWSEARAWLVALAEARAGYLDAFHPAVDWCLLQLASVLRSLKEHEALESVLEKRVSSRARTVGLTDQDSIQLLVELGDRAARNGQWARSGACFAKALEGVEACPGLRRPHRVSLLIRLARSCLLQARFDEAEQICADAWANCESDGSVGREYGQECGLRCLECCDAQAWTEAYEGYQHLQSGDATTAEYHLRKAVAMRQRGADFFQADSLGTILSNAGKAFQRSAFAKARRILKRSLKRRRCRGHGKDATADWLRVCLAVSCCRLANTDRALRYLKKALAGHQGRGGRCRKVFGCESSGKPYFAGGACALKARGLGKDRRPLAEQRWAVFEPYVAARGPEHRIQTVAAISGNAPAEVGSDRRHREGEPSGHWWQRLIKRLLGIFGMR